MTNTYYPFEASADALRFAFDSVGPRGVIRKAVDYSPLPITKGIFNLAFGNLQPDGSLDDMAVSDNGDMETIIATVAQTVVYFLSANPDKGVFFTGSTDARTRLYRIAIARSLNALTSDYSVSGIRNGVPEQFVTGIEYEAFLIFNR